MNFTREDYEHAARAAGYHIASACEGSPVVAFIDGNPCDWNPPEDDGDALRLAVKLNLIVGTYDTYASVCHTMILGGESDIPDEEVVWFHSTGGDPYAATRRAIFRAAIAIGRAMPAPSAAHEAVASIERTFAIDAPGLRPKTFSGIAATVETAPDQQLETLSRRGGQ